MSLTHSQLVEIGAEYLRTVMMCGLTVITEGCTGKWNRGEHPDVYGIDPYNISHVIDAKTSWNDFEADQTKPWRENGRGCGERRWYLCEQGVLTHAATDRTGWGLLVTDGTSVITDCDSQTFRPDLKTERGLIARALCEARGHLCEGEQGSRSSLIDPFLQLVESYVALVEQCSAVDAVINAGWSEYFDKRAEAVKQTVNAARKGKMARVRATEQGGLTYLVRIS